MGDGGFLAALTGYWYTIIVIVKLNSLCLVLCKSTADYVLFLSLVGCVDIATMPPFGTCTCTVVAYI